MRVHTAVPEQVSIRLTMAPVAMVPLSTMLTSFGSQAKASSTQSEPWPR